MQDLVSRVGSTGCGSGRVGIERDSDYFSAKALLDLLEELPKATLEAGMTHQFMPGLWPDDWGLTISA